LLEAEHKEKFAHSDLVFTWARYWQLSDVLDIMKKFEADGDNQKIVLYQD